MPSSMEVTFLESSQGIPLCKYIGLTETRSYPHVKNVTSHSKIFEKSIDGLEEFANNLVHHSKLGHCLLKGNLKRPLIDESRAGLTDRSAPTSLLVIDLDGLELPGTHLPRMFDTAEITKLSEIFIALLPKEFQTLSYVVQASASMGMKGNLCSLHFYMFLAIPIPAKAIKLWLKKVNLTTPDITSQITLSANGQSLKWPIDLSISDATHTCFIAEPQFEDKQMNPFLVPEQRTVFVKKKHAAIDLVPLAMNLNPELLSEDETQLKTTLRNAAGLSKKASNITTISSNHQPHELLLNPDLMNITVHSDANYPFVHCDVNGGDSHAYYFFADNPMYMYNFKGEPIWEIAKADADFFMRIPDLVVTKNGKRALVPIALRDFNTNTYYNGLYDADLDQFDSSFPLTPTAKNDIEGFYKTQSYPAPDYVIDGNVVFDPQHQGRNVNLDAKPMAYVNMYKQTEYMFNAIEPKIPLEYLSAHQIRKSCPMIYKIVFHMLGNGEQEFSHFINWLAFIYQNRKKSETSWILSGVQGTGKGVFANRILKPLFGTEHAPMKSLENIEEQFNLYMRNALFLVVDEFRMADSRGPIRMADKLKQAITEPYLSIRGMRANQKEEKSYVNYMFFTNRHDAMQIEPGDRRYNVSPRQEKMLIEVYPELTKELSTSKLDDELFHFAGTLASFKVMSSQIRTPLQNEAKDIMRDVGQSVFEEFIQSLKDGAISSLADILDISLANAMQAGEIRSAQLCVKFWMSEAFNHSEYTIVPIEQLRNVYHIISEVIPRVPQKQFTKDLNKFGFTKTRKRPFSDPSANAATGIEIKWAFANDAEGNALIEQYFDKKDLGLIKHD